ncbi:hypothetical protein [Methylotenera sp.]|uniref:hypothetical protein n=1 Tax=Methylotenera sp. TaxID=2051956 RepID=UPI00248A4BBD|nr:hypothetical protein [Methylotenera sp.]MDI1362562.1 hypothetical protein [Methylotenera sp.]
MVSKSPIGAQVAYKYQDDPQTYNAYVSFGQYDADLDEDEFGIPDDNIFYYFHEGEAEMKAFVEGAFEFAILDYELVYAEVESEI